MSRKNGFGLYTVHVLCNMCCGVKRPLESLTSKQTTKFSSANFQENVKSKLYYIENSKTSGQTV